MAVDSLLEEQVKYYRAIAGEYEDHRIEVAGGDEVRAAFDAFPITGDVLELACGPGAWTERLVRSADSVTAVDASPEMIDRARSRTGTDGVHFVEADLFSWRPDRRYDGVFFGFWLSHVPRDRFDSFWEMIADCLKSDGQVFFVDDNHRSQAELVEGADSSVVQRRLNDGTAYRGVKVPHQPLLLAQSIRALGWHVHVASSGPFYWGDARKR